MTGGRRGSLGLRRRALPSPPPCRFIPALSQDPETDKEAVASERRVDDVATSKESHPWLSGEAGQVSERTRIDGLTGAELPHLKAEVVEPDSLGDVLPAEQLGIASAEPDEYGHVGSRHSTRGRPDIGVVPADRLELKIGRSAGTTPMSGRPRVLCLL